MFIETYSREGVFPQLPLLHEWCTKYLRGFPYYYSPPKEQLIHPFDTVYVNEPKSLVVIAKEGSEVLGIATGVSLASFYLDYNVSYVFSPSLIEQFKEKNFQPSEVLYMGYFLMAENRRDDAKAVLEIFDPFIKAAKKWGKKHICYIEVLGSRPHEEKSSEPYGTIIPGFRHSSIELPNHSWPVLQPDGSSRMQSHDMAFYIMDIPPHGK